MRRLPLMFLLAACSDADFTSTAVDAEVFVGQPDCCVDAPDTLDLGAVDAQDEAADAQVGTPDAQGGTADAGGPARQDQDLPGGEAKDFWCGTITLRGTVTVPMGENLQICAGSEIIAVGPATALVVLGTLQVRGTAAQPVAFRGEGGWRGLRIGGLLDAEHFTLVGAARGLEGAPGGDVQVRHAQFSECDQALNLSDGGNFQFTTVLGGSAVQVSGGVLQMTDSTIDLLHPTRSPDCTNLDGGGLQLDHVRFTGCHCPLHINAAPDGVRITASIFDGATNPVMIAQTQAELMGNHFEGVDAHVLDIGGGFSANLTGSYFGGGAPRLSSRNQGQFVGADAFSATPIPGVGPR